MRNGINIAAMSELVSELKIDDRESHIHYKVASNLDGCIETGTDIKTLITGSTRAAREFNIFMDKGGRSKYPDYMEYAAGALGCCVLVTFVYGCTTKGITFDTINIVVRIENEKGIPSIKYSVHVKCNGESEDIIFIANMLNKYSPNHRVFQEENEIIITIRGKDGEDYFVLDPLSSFLPSYDSYKNKKIENCVSWIYGTQYQIDLNTKNGNISSYIVDQPKQYVGYDYGPNPQEILLSSILNEIKGELLSFRDGNIVVSGHVNLKGITGVDPEVEPKMDEIKVKIEDKSRSILDIKNSICDIISESTLLPIIVNKNIIEYKIYRDDQIIYKHPE